eukprot:TRINITY_DN5272_c0_g3_i1.p1 TRINITY_DN5272_c0_g3~~TRINITY_DN5272_c0_g3_i1.p1  ORF type:complete len:807 (-),score=147.37 TRINITY_DN5272_c0_g3_i1:260-2680(-)
MAHQRKKNNNNMRQTQYMSPSHGLVRPQQSSLLVAVRVRPLLNSEIAKGGKKDIIRVMDNGQMVLVLDPDESKDYLDQVQNRTKEKKYTFDVAFGLSQTNQDIFDRTIKDLVSGVMRGMNGTVFAYGSTGSGKTYTMVGSSNDPGLMVLSLEQVFRLTGNLDPDESCEITCSYLEVYNEVIYDLLVPKSGPLELREDPELGVVPAGLKKMHVQSAEQIITLLESGNKRRKTESTNANAVSSRSHAVLEIQVRRTPKNRVKAKQIRGKLCLVDLAGSERAAETNNSGQKLRDGANINQSLLALANCINALGKRASGKGGGGAYVPYRNSKLTRLLKDGLSGNSRTAMIATVAAASDQYHHSINTLKYADRAKEIKTHVIQNVNSVESHISDYQKIIGNLQQEVQNLRVQLEQSNSNSSSENDADGGNEEAQMMAWLDSLANEINENVEERINLQKALYELEDTNVQNKLLVQHLEEVMTFEHPSSQAHRESRKQKEDLFESIKENEEAGFKLRAEVAANEKAKQAIEEKINEKISQNQSSSSFLKILSNFRLQAVRVAELQFQMAIRDQVIADQRGVIGNLWKVLEGMGLDIQDVMEVARSEGLNFDGFFSDENPSGPPTVGAGNIIGRKKEGAIPAYTLAGRRANARYQYWKAHQSPTQQGKRVRPHTGGSPHQRNDGIDRRRLSSNDMDNGGAYVLHGRRAGGHKARDALVRNAARDPSTTQHNTWVNQKHKKQQQASAWQHPINEKLARLKLHRKLSNGQPFANQPKGYANYDNRGIDIQGQTMRIDKDRRQRNQFEPNQYVGR